jgi:hypothetical protein
MSWDRTTNMRGRLSANTSCGQYNVHQLCRIILNCTRNVIPQEKRPLASIVGVQEIQ